jgi:hypothetical protein
VLADLHAGSIITAQTGDSGRLFKNCVAAMRKRYFHEATAFIPLFSLQINKAFPLSSILPKHKLTTQ